MVTWQNNIQKSQIDQSEDYSGCANLFVNLSFDIKQIEFPAFGEHLLCNLAILQNTWHSVIKFLWFFGRFDLLDEFCLSLLLVS
jgi:hypothetical protein